MKLLPDIHVIAVYLMGSYIDGTQVKNSDIDLAVVYDHASLERAQAIQSFFADYSRDSFKKEIDLFMISMEHVRDLEKDLVVTRKATLNVKIASRLVYGTDVREQICISDMSAYIKSTASIPLHFMKKIRGSTDLDFDNLQYPNGADYYFGYLERAKHTHLGLELKPALTLVGWICTAKIALHANEYIGKKSDVQGLYGKLVGDEWTPFVEESYGLMRQTLAYELPRSSSQERLIHKLLGQLLEFERAYVEEYKQSQPLLAS